MNRNRDVRNTKTIRPCADCRGLNATVASAERIHYGSHDAIIGSLAAVMTGKMPLRTTSRKNITRQINVEQEDLDEMIEQGACGMTTEGLEDGQDSGAGAKKPKTEQAGGSSGSRDTGKSEPEKPPEDARRRRREAGMAKRDWENYYFSLPVSVRSRLHNIFKMNNSPGGIRTGELEEYGTHTRSGRAFTDCRFVVSARYRAFLPQS